LGEHCKLPQQVQGEAPAENEFGGCQKAGGGSHFKYAEYHVLQ